jgi:hypothetical protein
MNPRDMPKMSLEEARKKYIGRTYTRKVEMELSALDYAYTVSMKGKITGVFGPSFSD